MTTSPHTIVLIGEPRTEEAVAAATITPGMLLELTSDGEVQPHSDSDGFSERLFATEDALQGNDIDDDYSDGDIVNYALARPGDVIYAWLAGGEVSTVGKHLISNGDGCLHGVGSGSYGHPIAVALEAVDATDSSRIKSRIQVRVM